MSYWILIKEKNTTKQKADEENFKLVTVFLLKAHQYVTSRPLRY